MAKYRVADTACIKAGKRLYKPGDELPAMDKKDLQLLLDGKEAISEKEWSARGRDKMAAEDNAGLIAGQEATLAELNVQIEKQKKLLGDIDKEIEEKETAEAKIEAEDKE